MKLIRMVWICLNCGKYNEVSDEELLEDGQVQCCECGYALELNDDRFETQEREY